MATCESTEGATSPSSEQSHIEANPHQNEGAFPAKIFSVTIRGRGSRWPATLIHAVANNIGGFVHGDKATLERPGSLKAEPEATIAYDTWPAQAGDGVPEFRILMNLECCSAERGTFGRVMEAVDKMAAALGAEVTDAEGCPLTNDQREREKKRVEAALETRRVSRNVVKVAADGTREKHGLTSFHVERYTPRGRYLGQDHFVAPALDYYDGQILGFRHAMELLDALAAQTGWSATHWDVEQILRAACAAGPVDFKSPSTANVAGAIVDIAAHALFFFAQHANYRAFIERFMESAERSKEWHEEAERKSKEDLVARLRGGRDRARAKAASRRGRRHG